MVRWEDYYKLLQVHYDAEFDVIEAAYKRLCKKYHPDLNNSKYAEERIKKINVAYETLKDEKRRRVYHTQWVEKNKFKAFSPLGAARSAAQETTAPRQQPAPPPPRPQPQAPPKEHMWKDGTDFSYDEKARKALIDYMILVSQAEYEKAFHLLTDYNKGNISFDKFKEWQDAVSKLYSLGGFRTKVFKAYEDKWLGIKKYDKAIEFEIDASEKDIKTGIVNDSHFTKIVVWEKDEWKVFLEYSDLNFLIYKFNFLNYSRGKTTILEEFAEKEIRVDSITGMLNKRGFFDYIEKENSRFIRYNSIFTIAIFSFKEENKQEAEIDKKHLEHMAYCFKKHVRDTDVAAHIGAGVFALMLIETDHTTAMIPCKRMIRSLKKMLNENLHTKFEIQAGVHEHSGRDPVKSFEIACTFAGLTDMDSAQDGFRRESAML